MTHFYVCQDSQAELKLFVHQTTCDTVCHHMVLHVPCLVSMCAMTHRQSSSGFYNRVHAWHCVPWHIPMCAMTHFYVCHDSLKEAEILQPWVINGHNTHTPDSREACQAIAFYDNFTPEKSRPIKIEPLSVAWILLHKRHRKNSRRIPSLISMRVMILRQSSSGFYNRVQRHYHPHNAFSTASPLPSCPLRDS